MLVMVVVVVNVVHIMDGFEYLKCEQKRSKKSENISKPSTIKRQQQQLQYCSSSSYKQEKCQSEKTFGAYMQMLLLCLGLVRCHTAIFSFSSLVYFILWGGICVSYIQFFFQFHKPFVLFKVRDFYFPVLLDFLSVSGWFFQQPLFSFIFSYICIQVFFFIFTLTLMFLCVTSFLERRRINFRSHVYMVSLKGGYCENYKKKFFLFMLLGFLNLFRGGGGDIKCF